LGCTVCYRRRRNIFKDAVSEQEIDETLQEGENIMRRIRLTREERMIEDSLDNFVPVDKKEYEEIGLAIAARKKDAVLNIRVNSHDLASIRHKAERLGIRYQTFISEVIHKIAQA